MQNDRLITNAIFDLTEYLIVNKASVLPNSDTYFHENPMAVANVIKSVHYSLE